MADSEISTSLCNVTRRELLTGTTLAPLPGSLPFLEATHSHTDQPDPALSLYQKWSAAHQRTAKLCCQQQKLETELVRTIGFPDASNPISRIFEDTPVSTAEKPENQKAADVRANAELAAHQARWDEADAAIGYSAAKQKEEKAAADEQKLIESLWATPAHSLAGAGAKLDAILKQGEWCEECSEFPWPQIRSVLRDLIRIGHLGECVPQPCDADRA
jgi:hypothetical protein